MDRLQQLISGPEITDTVRRECDFCKERNLPSSLLSSAGPINHPPGGCWADWLTLVLLFGVTEESECTHIHKTLVTQRFSEKGSCLVEGTDRQSNTGQRTEVRWAQAGMKNGIRRGGGEWRGHRCALRTPKSEKIGLKLERKPVSTVNVLWYK